MLLLLGIQMIQDKLQMPFVILQRRTNRLVIPFTLAVSSNFVLFDIAILLSEAFPLIEEGALIDLFGGVGWIVLFGC